MRQHAFEFGRLEFVNVGRIVNDPPAVGRHPCKRPGYELQADAQRPEERIIQQELRRARTSFCSAVRCRLMPPPVRRAPPADIRPYSRPFAARLPRPRAPSRRGKPPMVAAPLDRPRANA